MGAILSRVGAFVLNAFTGMGILDFLGFGRSDDDDNNNNVLIALGTVVVLLGAWVYKLKMKK
jgi:hypothetical protein